MLRCRKIIIQRSVKAPFLALDAVEFISILKLHASSNPSVNAFSAYGDGYVDVNGVRFSHSVVVLPDRDVLAWQAARFTDLTTASFDLIAELAPEIVVFGSGARQRFPHPRLLAPLSSRGIGVETMDVHAACRTYNILVAEGRKVAAALLIEAAN